MVENPFVYGEVVPASAFVGREAELDRLAGDLAAGQKVFLISPRRFGKSSLIHHAFRTLARRRIRTLELTVSSFSSYLAFLEGYAQALARLEREAARTRSWLRDVFRGAQPELGHDPAGPGGPGGLTVRFPGVRTAADVSRLAEDVFTLPQRIAEGDGRRLAIALDEFQEVAAFDGGTVEQALRAAAQHQRQVGYVFAGSEPSLMERMLGPRRPFYKAGPVMRLGRIPAPILAGFVEHRMRRSGLVPEPGLGEAVVDLAANLPYDVQRLAHETWDDVRAAARRRVQLEDLHRTLRRLLAEHRLLFEGVWQRLTLPQRATLRAVVVEHGEALLSADVRARYRLGGASSVQSSLAALRRTDLIDRDDDGRYLVVDSLFREWVARTTY